MTANTCGSTICSDMTSVCLFTVCSPPPEHLIDLWHYNMTLNLQPMHRIQLQIMLSSKCFFFYFFFYFHYLAYSKEWYLQIKWKTHIKRHLQCSTQGFFIVQIPLMKLTQTNPWGCSSKINIKVFIYNFSCPFQKINNYQTLMTSLWRLWTYKLYKPKITVWLEAWLNHNSVEES